MRRTRLFVLGSVLLCAGWAEGVGAAMQIDGVTCTGGSAGHCQPKAPQPAGEERVTAWGFRPAFWEDPYNRYLYDSLFRGQSGPYLRERLPDAQLPGEAVSAANRTPVSPCDEDAQGEATLAGDPIDYSNGNLVEYEYDFTSNGEMPLYNSISSMAGAKFTNGNLRNSLRRGGSKCPDKDMESIRRDLMHARVAQLSGATPGNPIRVPAQSIKNFHNTIFSNYGARNGWGALPVFGGDIPVLGNMGGDNWGWRWCSAPACQS